MNITKPIHPYRRKKNRYQSSQKSLKEFTATLAPNAQFHSRLFPFADNQWLNYDPSAQKTSKTNHAKITVRLAKRYQYVQKELKQLKLEKKNIEKEKFKFVQHLINKEKELQIYKEQFKNQERELIKQYEKENNEKINAIKLEYSTKNTELRNKIEQELRTKIEIREAELIARYEKENDEKMNDLKSEYIYINKNIELTEQALREHDAMYQHDAIANCTIMNTDSVSLSLTISDDNILNHIGNQLLSMNIKNGEDVLRNEIKQELTEQSALNEAHTNNTSQRIEIEEERKKNERLQNKNKQLLSELEDLRKKLLKKEFENNKIKGEYLTMVQNIRESLDSVDMKCIDAGSESDTESVLSELEFTNNESDKSNASSNDSLSYIRIANIINSNIVNKLKTKLREMLCEVAIDFMGEPMLDLFSCRSTFGKPVEEDMEELFEELNEEKDASYDTVEISIDNIINGIITSQDLTEKIIAALNITAEIDDESNIHDITPLLIIEETTNEPLRKPMYQSAKAYQKIITLKNYNIKKLT